MDFEQDNTRVEPSPPEPSEPVSYPPEGTPPADKPPKKRTGWKIFWGIVTALSILANIVLFMMLVGMVVMVFAAGQKDIFTEDVIQSGQRTTKIAVIKLQGVIDDEQSQDVYRQLKLARKDRNVKGLIIRVDSPGGTISASDQIHNEILKYRRQTDRPVVAFMQGVAASGGYYTSVACDRIIAEPTVITGSIGVMGAYFVLQELLEEVD